MPNMMQSNCILMKSSLLNCEKNIVIEYRKSIIKSLKLDDIVYLSHNEDYQKGSIIGVGCIEFIFPLELLSDKPLPYLLKRYETLIIRYAIDYMDGFSFPSPTGYVKSVIDQMKLHYQNRLLETKCSEQNTTYAILIKHVTRIDLSLDIFTYLNNESIYSSPLNMCYVKHNTEVLKESLKVLLPSTNLYEESRLTNILMSQECDAIHQILDQIELWLYSVKDNPYIKDETISLLYKRFNAIAKYVSN